MVTDRVALLGIGLLLGGVAACGTDVSPSSQANEGSSSLAASGCDGMPPIRDLTEIRIPPPEDEQVVPPIRERDCESYDIDGPNAPVTAAGYYGYLGPFYSQLQWDTGITVIEKSLSLEPGDVWVADVLVRNDTPDPVGTITLSAQVLDRSGEDLETVRASSFVPEARPGEPVPVRLVSSVPSSSVSNITFEATAGSTPPNTERHLDVTFDWPPAYFDHEQPVETGLYSEKTMARPYPYFQSFRVNPVPEGLPIQAISNVIGWMDLRGRLVYVSRAFPTEETPPENFQFSAHYAVTVDDPQIAKEVADLQPLWWGVGTTK